MISRESSIEMQKKNKKNPANLRDRDMLPRMCCILISGLASLFSRLAFGEKSFFIDPETPEKAFISVFKSYSVYFGSFKCHILYFKASIVEKIRSH